jgi:hypothetical protein
LGVDNDDDILPLRVNLGIVENAGVLAYSLWGNPPVFNAARCSDNLCRSAAFFFFLCAEEESHGKSMFVAAATLLEYSAVAVIVYHHLRDGFDFCGTCLVEAIYRQRLLPYSLV